MSIPPPRVPFSDDEPDEQSRKAIRPRRLLLGCFLLAVGLLGSIFLSSTVPRSSQNATTTIIHQAVFTVPHSISGVRVRPLLSSSAPAGEISILISFNNASTTVRRIDLRDVTLEAAGHPMPLTATVSMKVLQPGQFLTTLLAAYGSPVPGLTLRYRPSFAGGASIAWLLWQ